MTGTATWHDSLEAYVHDVQPLTYSNDPPSADHVDVVVVRLRAYSVKYAPDSSDAPSGKTHLLLEPYKFVTDKASKDNFFFDDIVIDNSTDLPTHVSFSGPDGLQFIVDYTTADRNWVVSHVHYEQTRCLRPAAHRAGHGRDRRRVVSISSRISLERARPARLAS